jgi:manganese/zinc/iron transport system substrate-binding protein
MKTTKPSGNTIIVFVLFLFIAIGASSCEGNKQPTEKRLKVVCTTGMLGDALHQIAGDRIRLSTLMGPGVDPHLYKATQGDLQLLTEADLILYNGLHLEGKMGEVFEKLGRTRRVVALGETLPKEKLLKLEAKGEVYDPHLWFDVSLWASLVLGAAEELAKSDTMHAEAYRTRARHYADSLMMLHQWVKESIDSIPPEQRILITAHDAFGYFGRAYGISVRGLQGISTASEFGLRDLSNLVSYLSKNNIRAVFVESSVPTKSLEAVVEGCRMRGHKLVIGGTLFSDALGNAGTPEASYVGMVRHNVNTITGALNQGGDE